MLEGAINLAERATGKDLDGDGYVAGTGCPVSKSGTGCPFRNPALTLPVYPALDPEKLPKKAEHGVLGQLAPTAPCSDEYQLDGTWVNVPGTWGVHTTIMPAPGSTSEQMFGAFHFLTQEYTETLKFRKNTNPVRNRLGSNEQFIGALNYETSIVDRNNAEIHFEMGQYLWLGVWTHEGAVPYDKEGDPVLYSRKTTEADVKNDFLFPTLGAGSQGPQFIPPFSISRQGSIPHGNAIQLFGSQPSNPHNPKHLDTPIRPYKDIPGAPEIYPGADKGCARTQDAPQDVLWDADSVAFHHSMGYTAKQLNDVTAKQLGDPEGRPSSRVKPAFAAKLANYPDGMNPNSGEAYMGRIFNGAQKLTQPQPDGKVGEDPLFPYCVQPNVKLVEANLKLIADGFEIISHDQFTLNTVIPQGLQGGSLNNHGTERYCKVHDMKVTMWISKVKNKATGKIYQQLQYEQVMHFQFGFGVNGAHTLWPHIQCNTLRRKSDLDDEVSQGKRARSS